MRSPREKAVGRKITVWGEAAGIKLEYGFVERWGVEGEEKKVPWSKVMQALECLSVDWILTFWDKEWYYPICQGSYQIGQRLISAQSKPWELACVCLWMSDETGYMWFAFFRYFSRFHFHSILAEEWKGIIYIEVTDLLWFSWDICFSM